MKSHKTSQGPVPWSSTDSHLASVKHFVKKLVKTLGLEPEKQKTGFRPTCLGTEKPVWLVVSTPLKNIIQLGWWHSQYMEKTNVPNHQRRKYFMFFCHQYLPERPIPNENQWLRVFVASANRSWKIHSFIWKKIWNMDGTWMEHGWNWIVLPRKITSSYFSHVLVNPTFSPHEEKIGHCREWKTRFE